MQKAAFAALALVLSGYASTRAAPVRQESTAAWQGKTITATQRDKRDFGAMTAGKAALSLVGMTAAFKAGNKIVRDNAVEDPAVAIRDALLEDLARSWQLTIIPVSGMATGSSLKATAKQHPNADLLLDVRTFGWGFIYFLTDLRHYHVIYSVKLRLFDSRKSAVIAAGYCVREPYNTRGAPSYDELLANRAARLKEELSKVGGECLAELRTNVIGAVPES